MITVAALLMLLILPLGTAASECQRPPATSISVWNTLSADAQEAACSAWEARQDGAPLPKPANWNALNAAEQTYWLDYGTQRTSAPFTPAPRCGRACGQSWTPQDFADSQAEIDRLGRQIGELDSRRTPARRSQPPATETALRAGRSTFYSQSDGTTGTAMTVPPVTFYNFSNGTTGTATSMAPVTFYNFRNGNESVTGSSTAIGGTQFHNFDNGVSGSSTQIGQFGFHNFSNGTRCVTTQIGTSTFTNCY